MDRKQFYISIQNKQVEVTEEIYLAYYRSKRRDRYFEQDIKTETPIRDKNGTITGYAPSKEDSLDRLIGKGEDFADAQVCVEDIIINHLMLDELHEALGKLYQSERELIETLFFSNGGDGLTERKCAEMMGIKQQSINERKRRVLGKLKKLLEN